MLAVDGISFSVDRGELVALVGESGCGKTTTAQAVLRLVEATSGRVSFDGRDITELPNRALRPLRRSMQIIYQDPYESLDPRMTVRDAVEEPMLIHGLGGSRAARRELVREAVARVELTPPDLFLERYPHELSGGQRQRVAIAASLVLEPELLVADEPVSMLDVSVRAGVLNLLDRLRQDGLGILMITHDLSTAARYADRIAVMYLGRIVEIGPASEIVENPQHHTPRLCCPWCHGETRVTANARRSSPAKRRMRRGFRAAVDFIRAAPSRSRNVVRTTRSCSVRVTRCLRITVRLASWPDPGGPRGSACATARSPRAELREERRRRHERAGRLLRRLRQQRVERAVDVPAFEATQRTDPPKGLLDRPATRQAHFRACARRRLVTPIRHTAVLPLAAPQS